MSEITRRDVAHATGRGVRRGRRDRLVDSRARCTRSVQAAAAPAGRRAEGAVRAAVPHARAADRSDHPGRERQAGRAAGRRAGVDRRAAQRERRTEGDDTTTGLAWLDTAMTTQRREATSSAPRRRSRPRCSTSSPSRRTGRPTTRAGVDFFMLAAADDGGRLLHERGRHARRQPGPSAAHYVRRARRSRSTT